MPAPSLFYRITPAEAITLTAHAKAAGLIHFHSPTPSLDTNASRKKQPRTHYLTTPKQRANAKRHYRKIKSLSIPILTVLGK
jgi:hypothetical protein